MPAKLCLNAIVRNEADKILRMLESVRPYIDCVVIYDTGSTDDTINKITEFMADNHLLGKVVQGEFVNFEQARNAALNTARHSNLIWDYAILVDADMELVVEDPNFRDKLDGGLAYTVVQKAGSLSYDNARFVSRLAVGQYTGVTHEYLDVPVAGRIDGIWFRDHADGSNRPNKFQRDIDLLLPELEKDPKNARYWFYLAQSYRDAGKPDEAASAYRKRIELGGWDEEVWNAMVNLAAALKDCGDEAGFILNLLNAYNYRPSRAESLYDLAKHYREKGMNFAALAIAEEGMKIKRPGDMLFVNDYVYNTGLKEEFSIAAFYDKNRRRRGYSVCDSLALDGAGTDWSREQARQNLFHYIEPLSAFVPSFKAQKIDFTPPADYTPMNPSIAGIGGGLACVMRTVNYSMDADGRYLIRSTNGEANSTNPIHTRNFLLNLTDDFQVEKAREIYMPKDFPKPAFDLVVGFEDMRLFEWKGEMFINACVREQNYNGWCEQWLARIEQVQYEDIEWCRLTEARAMLPVHREHEKNWAPWPVGDDLFFGYRLGEVVDDQGEHVFSHPTGRSTGHISGSSQVIRVLGGYLSVVHEARHLPGTGKRYYQHRFVFFDSEKRVTKISLPFYLHDKVIEFVAGIAYNVNSQRLVISYGREDKEAWLASMSLAEVMDFVWHG